MEDRCTKGWSWGEFSLEGEALALNMDGKLGFKLPYGFISNSSLTGKNEIALEFAQDDTMEEDIVCEMRLFIPDNESAEQLNKELVERAQLRAYSGDAIVTLHELPLIVPRGKYSLDMFNNFFRLHGKTYDYKIMFKNVTKAFLLPHPDGIHVSLVIGLETPIRQGNTLHPFIVMNFNKDTEETVTLNMPPADIKRHFGEELTDTLEGKLFDIVSRLLKVLVGVNIIIPGIFRSFGDTHAIKCSIKASDGYLFPLQKSFIFINKPVIYIPFEDIRFIEFARVSERSVSTNRSFDLNIATKGSNNHQFTGLDRQEYKPLFQFLEKKKIPIRNIEEEEYEREKRNMISEAMELEEDESEDESFAEGEHSEESSESEGENN
jgi:structure-specific recognition protein 1